MIHTEDQTATLDASSTTPRVVLEAMIGGTVRRVELEGGSCLIGQADFCDLQAPGPLVYGEVHLQNGALWIETADEHDLIVNGRRCRRLALRDGDCIQLGDVQIIARINPTDSPAAADNLAALSATELCDRIEAEQAAVTEFERKRLAGWEALLRQLEDVMQQESATTATTDARFESVVTQLHAVADQLAARTQELAAQEALLAETADELKRAQDLMAGRLERVLQQFQDGELRASA